MASESNNEKHFNEAKKLHMKGVDGDKKAVKSAYEKFLKLRESEPNNALFEAYHGSTLVLIARDAVKPFDKEDKAQEGLASLNRAVTLNPTQKEIRFLRANVCLRLPEEFFNCSKIAIEDFSFLLNGYQKNSDYLSKNQVSEILRNLSIAYKNDGKPEQATMVLERFSKIKPKK